MKKRNTAAKLTAAALTVCMLAGSTVSAVPTKVMAAETGEDQWEAIQSVISRYYGEWNSANGGGAVSDQLPDHIRVEVSSRDTNPDFDPEDALNGNAEQNQNGYGWVSSCPAWGDQAEGDFWMEVEFAEPVTVARWAVKWDGYVRSGYDANNPKDFSLQISKDGTTWEQRGLSC